ncbi:hypothetical protein BDZ94DRAFT_1311579 [Collybia nuda]|uniref:Uncharacterized protein n=1 Tax=Collybia nuda TaxID=64659 RepID=A0A9P5Y2W5_9AGAR|nr:hypothetical protein BDZ94DRAFT_1311579 [Collybia nuda]
MTSDPGIKRVSTGNTSPESAEIIPHEHSPDQSYSAQHNTQGEAWRCRPRTSNLTLGVDHSPQHHDARYETLFETVTDAQDKVATATSSTLTFFDKPRISRRRSDDSVLYDWAAAGISSSHHNRRSTPMPLGTLSARPSTKGVDRPTTMHAIKKLSTKSLRSAQLVIDLKNLHESYDILKPDSRNQTRTPKSSTDPPPAEKTLRRKKRMTLFRASTPSSVTSPSVPDSASITSHSPVYSTHTLPVPTKATHTRSQSQPYASVRLGHPSRPYYTAIRPHMSRPSSPVEPTDSLRAPSPNPSRPLSLPPPPRAPSPGIFSVLSTTSFLSMPEREPLPLFSSSTSPSVYDAAPRPFAFGSSMSHRSGFSLSGETELRIALAREQEEFGMPARDRYRYRDMAPATHETGMMKKVNKLKRGLKDLVSRKT